MNSPIQLFLCSWTFGKLKRCLGGKTTRSQALRAGRAKSSGAASQLGDGSAGE